MLEPLYRCNLQCKGCGKISQTEETLSNELTVDECVAAAEECRAPVVSVAGGEPLLHPAIHRIVKALVERRIFVYLCTNALLLRKRIKEFRPSPYLTFNIHLDGLRDRHDALVCRAGVFDHAVDGIRLLLSQGFRVTTNTTIYGGESPEDTARFFDFLMSLGIEGMTVSPGFNYEEAADQKNFLGRNRTISLFKRLFDIGRDRNWCFNHSSLYLDFLAGYQDYQCRPWANPTRSVLGWQRPCYLISDGYTSTYRQLVHTTDWSKYGVGRDPRCAACMVHCGFEPSAVMDAVIHPLKPWKMKRGRAA
jgi:hopanoid biosynthesis associated radical SAM protein HpnH